jgi:hypothetical protein
MLGWIRRERRGWTLHGWDVFAGEGYPIPGSYPSEARAEAAARRRLKKLERDQPSELSGGQDGIQDQVYIQGPTGRRRRILP